MQSKHVLLFFLILLGTLSLSLKLTGRNTMPPAEKRELNVLTQYMNLRGLIPGETFNLNREGSFIAHIYSHQNCDGGWLISPMPRNSEAVSLFARQATYRDYPMGSVFYVLDGKSHEAFPELDLWVSQKIHGVKHMFGLRDGPEPTVFAVRSFGTCNKENLR